MNKVTLTLSLVGAVCASQTSANNLSFQVTGELGSITNQDGGAGIESNGGIDGVDSRALLGVDLSVARSFGNWTGAVALGFGNIANASPDLDDDDATLSTSDITLRIMNSTGNWGYGGFIGFGRHIDGGDSDEPQTYQYAGLEFDTDTSFGDVFVQLGYLDSDDEYDEGTQDAPFINVGGSYDFSNDFSLVGSVGYAGGIKYGDSDYPNRILNAALRLEREFNGFTGHIGYEFTQISYDDSGDRYGDTFGTISLGVTFAFGGTAEHGNPLPPLGNWVAFNANEVE